jgi:hypothetical protein
MVVSLVIVFLPPGQISTKGSKKAIILSSANDYYRKDGEPDFNEGNDAKFNDEENNWTLGNWINMFGAVDPTTPGHDGLPGVFGFLLQVQVMPIWSIYLIGLCIIRYIIFLRIIFLSGLIFQLILVLGGFLLQLDHQME